MKRIIGNKNLQLILFAGLCIFHFRFGIIPGWNLIVSDFPNYYVASKIIQEGRDPFLLYQDSLFNIEVKHSGIDVQGQFSLYSPPTAYAFLPLSWFSPYVAKHIWMCFNLLLLGVTFFLIRQILQTSWLFSANIVLLSGFCLTNDLMLGQIYLTMLTALLAGFWLIQRKKILAGSFFLGLVMTLKYMPVIWMPYYLIRKSWTVLFGIFFSFLLFNFVCMLHIGIPVYEHFIRSIFIPHITGKIIGQVPFSIQFQSFESLLNRLFVKDSINNLFPWMESRLLFIVGKICVFSSLLFFNMRLLKKAKKVDYLESVYLALSISLLLLLEPGSATYHLLILVFPTVLSLKIWIKQQLWVETGALLCSLACIGFLSVVANKMAVSGAWPLLLQYNRLWFLLAFEGVLLLGFEKCINYTLQAQQQVHS